jgi:hypothetical protein
VKLVRLALRVFDWLRKQDGAFERTFKSDSGGNIAFQESDDGCAGCNPLVGGRYAPGHSKSNAYNSIQDNAGIPSKYTTGMKGNNLSAPWHHSEFGCGALTHDGSYNLFKWDHTKGCMVPFKLSNPKATLSASI